MAPYKYCLTCFTTPNIFIALEGDQTGLKGGGQPMIIHDYKGGGAKLGEKKITYDKIRNIVLNVLTLILYNARKLLKWKRAQ